MDTPDVVMYQVPAQVKDPYSPVFYTEALNSMFQGAVNADGSWALQPEQWTVTKEGTGLYRVVHSKLNIHYSLNLDSANMVQMLDSYFDVQVVDANANPVDGGFAFAISFMPVVSPPAPPT